MIIVMATPVRYQLNYASKGGFTLLEMSIVLVIIGFILVGAMVVFTQSLSAKQLNDTNAKLATLQKALYDFRVVYNRLPCPADVTLALTDANFGVEAANPGGCTGGTPVANFSSGGGGGGASFSGVCGIPGAGAYMGMDTAPYGYAIPYVGAVLTTVTGDSGGFLAARVGSTITGVTVFGGGAYQLTLNTGGFAGGSFSGAICTFGPGTNPNLVEGMVPTRTLRLPDDYASDAWGRRFMYAAATDMTQNSAFSIYQSGDPTTRITVYNDLYDSLGAVAAAENTTQAAYVLLSFGPNGHGGYTRNGGTSRVNTSSVNTDELINCYCSSAAVSGAISAAFVQKEATLNSGNGYDGFDDVVVYGTRAGMMFQSALRWYLITGRENNMVCPSASTVCSTVGLNKSCYCSQ